MGERIERDSEWQEAATAASIAAARKVVLGDDAAINKNTPVGRLSDLEWGWIVTSAIFAWIATHAEQATVKGLDVEQTIRFSMLDPNPWDAGMISTGLPKRGGRARMRWPEAAGGLAGRDYNPLLVGTVGSDPTGGSCPRSRGRFDPAQIKNQSPHRPYPAVTRWAGLQPRPPVGGADQ